MPKLTKKYFAILHQKMLKDRDYRIGYRSGTARRERFAEMDVANLRSLRRVYLEIISPYTLGVARVLLEIICEKTSREAA